MPSDRAVMGKVRAHEGHFAWIVLASSRLVYGRDFLGRQLRSILVDPIAIARRSDRAAVVMTSVAR